MHRSLTLAAALLALAACKVNRTPQHVLNPRDPAAVERREAEQEIEARLGAFREAMVRADTALAVQTLAPVSTAHVMGPDGNDGRPRFGPDGVRDMLAQLGVPSGTLARTPDLLVQADPRDGIAWFATHVQMLPPTGEAGRLRISGVFTRQEGEWRLIQVHVSRPETPPPARSAATAPDSAPPAAASPASGAAPPEDE